MRARLSKGADSLLVFAVLALIVFGLVMLASASSHLGKTKFDDSYYYLKHQFYFGLLPGLAGLIAGSFIYYRHYQKWALILLLLTLILLLLVFTPLGLRAGGADRWLRFGSFSFQPAELLKISFIIYLSAWLQRKGGFIPFLIIMGAVAFLLLKQPATSTAALLMAAALITYFMSGIRLYQFFLATVIGAGVLILLIYLTPYRWERVITFLNPEADRQASGYHLNQALNAIGSGGLTGVGYGQSTTKIKYLPEPIGDSIFAVIAEELGFVGALGQVALIMLFTGRMLVLARRSPDQFGYLLIVGFASLIALQSFVHIAAVSGVIPLTGMPLPFISYGGTGLFVFMTMTGIVLNISKYTS